MDLKGGMQGAKFVVRISVITLVLFNLANIALQQTWGKGAPI